MSPSSASSSFIRRAAPEPNKRALYVGGLDPRVSEDVLRQIFETTGHVQNVKIIPDKNVGAVSLSKPSTIISPSYARFWLSAVAMRIFGPPKSSTLALVMDKDLFNVC